MKKISFIVIMMIVATSLFAQWTGPTETTRSSRDVGLITVAQALELQDDQRCTLQGTLVRQIGRDKEDFIFTDGTTEIRIDLDMKLQNALGPFDATTQVEIYGEVDTERGVFEEFDVKAIRKL